MIPIRQAVAASPVTASDAWHLCNKVAHYAPILGESGARDGYDALLTPQ